MKPSEHDPERWRRIDAVLEAALETPPDRRTEFLADACGDDDDLRSEVEALLEAHARAGSRFDSPGDLMDEALGASERPEVEGRRVGPFRLVREIGRGGMGVVYLAEDTRLGRPVALKALPPYLGVGERAKRRFLSEARAIAALDHPNIATLYEADETEEGQLYMAFALYEGETLEAHIRRGPLAPAEAIRITAKLAAGLAAAHARGILHRDVKPSNVLLTQRGEVKLIDFGVAKVAGEDVTRDGVRPGTVAYMSPEQAAGGSLDARADLWSLGVVLYEMLTGDRPFAGGDPAALIRAIEQEEPEPASALREDLPDDVERVVDRLLSRSPDGRYRSADELLSNLRTLPGGETAAGIGPGPGAVARPGRSWSRSRKWRAGAAALVVVTAGAGGAWLATRDTGASGGQIRRLAVLPLTDRTGDDAHGHLVAGVHDALTAELGAIGSFDVVSRTSAARYRSTEKPLAQIAEELEVDAVVEGSVFLEGDTLGITATLVATRPERQLWTENYRRAVGGVFELSSEAARQIAARLGVSVASADPARLERDRAVDPLAYDAYALGRFHLEQRSPDGFAQAQRYLLEAIDLDSTFAPAYAALAQAYGSATFFGMERPSEMMPRIRTLAETALRHDSALADAHTVMMAVELYWDWDWERAERHGRRAIELNPSHAAAHRNLSEVLAVRGRYEEALASVERGAELGRMVPFSTFRPAVVLNYMGEYERAIEHLEEGLAFFPDFWVGHFLLCEALSGEGRYDDAITACEKAARLSDRIAMTLGLLGYVYARAGQRDDAVAVIEELEARAEATYVGGTHIAQVYGALGDPDRAFAWLDRAYEERDVGLVHLNDHVFFDPLRADSRFDLLLEKVGLGRS